MQKSPLDKLKLYLSIYWTMFKIGITTFGGGYAMIAVFDKELGERKKWIDQEELLDYLAISQITPGVIAVNVATFVGRKKAGILGAIFGTLGVVTPSLIIITIIAALLTNFAGNEYVMHAFAGIRICVCVLIINATIRFVKQTVVDVLTLATFLCVFLVAAFTRVSTVYIVLFIILVSIVFTIIKGISDKKKHDGGAKC